jgi:hypothetical protein
MTADEVRKLVGLEPLSPLLSLPQSESTKVVVLQVCVG